MHLNNFINARLTLLVILVFSLCVQASISFADSGKESQGIKLNQVRNKIDTPSITSVQVMNKMDDEYLLSSGDKIHIQVFENPDLTLDLIVSDAGSITFPLIGPVNAVGLTPAKVARRIAYGLKHGGFINNPQVSLTVTEVVGSKITLLGYVNKPGVYPLTKSKISIAEAIALAGGVVNGSQPLASAGDVAIVSGVRNGVPFKREINLPSILASGSVNESNALLSGDTLYIPVASSFYIYGEVKEPGTRKIEPNMNVLQALAISGGLTIRGTQRNIKVFRKNAEGIVLKSRIGLSDLIQADDVLFVEESFF
jgi:polysaccharide export outer membrane protein